MSGRSASRWWRVLLTAVIAVSLLPLQAPGAAAQGTTDCGQYRWYVYTSPTTCPSSGEECRLELARLTPAKVLTLTGVRVLGSYRTEGEARLATRSAMSKVYKGTTSSGCKATVNGALYDVRNFVGVNDCQSSPLSMGSDQDDDGAPDNVDTCRNTPPGTLVDWWGCPCQAAPAPAPVTPQTECRIPPVVAPSCPYAPPVSEGEIDRFMDYLAAQIQFAQERASTPWLIQSSRASLAEFTVKMAADLGLAVWQQAHALERMHIAGRITLNAQQTERTKVLGHWASWLSYRENYYRTYLTSAGMGVDQIPPPLEPHPSFPLYGPIAGQVPTPPQLIGDPAEVIEAQEFSYATVLTSAEIIDLWYFRGLFHTLYLAYNGQFSEAFVTGVLLNVPYVGPSLMAANVIWQEANSLYQQYETGINPLTWDQHLANIAAGANIGITGYKTLQLRNLNADIRKIEEGFVGADLKARIGNGDKSYKVVNQEPKVEVMIGCKKYEATPVTLEYAVVGDYVGKTGKAPFDVKGGRFLAVKDVDGGDRFFKNQNGQPGDPVFFLGEKGYHLWKHLTEQNGGYATTFPSLLQTFAENPKYLPVLRELQAMAADPASSLGAANSRYVESFVNPLIHDSGIKKTTGFYMFERQDGTLSPAEANYFPEIPCGQGKTAVTYPVRVSIDPAKSTLKNVFVLKALQPGDPFTPSSNLVLSAIGWSGLSPSYLNFPALGPFLPAARQDDQGPSK